MIVQYIGRAIITFLLFSPLIIFFANSSSEIIVYNNIAHAFTEEPTQVPREVRIVVDGKSSYNDLPETLNGYPKPPERVVDAIQSVSKKKGFDWRIVYAICILESGCGTYMQGDGGLSGGWYHIHNQNVCEYNGNKPECIKDNDRYDINVATTWTVNRLLSNQYRGRYEMIRSHNGLPGDNSNAIYVTVVEKLVRTLP